MSQRIVTDARASCLDSAPNGSDRCAGEHPSTPAPASSPMGLRFCRDAHTVVEGYLCDEPVVVSNACRKPDNAFDAYVCDEPRMQSLQHSVVRSTLSVLGNLFRELFHRS